MDKPELQQFAIVTGIFLTSVQLGSVEMEEDWYRLTS